jgi:hypothetical protein
MAFYAHSLTVRFTWRNDQRMIRALVDAYAAEQKGKG